MQIINKYNQIYWVDLHPGDKIQIETGEYITLNKDDIDEYGRLKIDAKLSPEMEANDLYIESIRKRLNLDVNNNPEFVVFRMLASMNAAFTEYENLKNSGKLSPEFEALQKTNNDTTIGRLDSLEKVIIDIVRTFNLDWHKTNTVTPCYCLTKNMDHYYETISIPEWLYNYIDREMRRK